MANKPCTDTPCACSIDDSKRNFLTRVTTTFGVLGAACAALPFIRSMTPADNVKALATLEVDLTEIPEGSNKTYLWRGKPVFIWHRNAQQIADAKKADASDQLLDPQTDAERVQNEKYLVVMGVCTHLGCVPIQGGEHGGWRCPCHGSQFDNSGRLRRGPASTNLEIPPYAFIDDTTIKIG
ncbi:MAG: ubiquinol-cytochrome c reductase iron-sulfur subunit [Alphaproteobacteria bacterium]|nr:ubiquinol-cytochrome c reductase iron-sulfur subunit [Alphaproteobacteria bacterium]MDD9919551.1 ubiquinol-cytochrome c reductase iron-sulfur subunit [Alphaproteobacteria bacterium]